MESMKRKEGGPQREGSAIRVLRLADVLGLIPSTLTVTQNMHDFSSRVGCLLTSVGTRHPGGAQVKHTLQVSRPQEAELLL